MRPERSRLTCWSKQVLRLSLLDHHRRWRSRWLGRAARRMERVSQLCELRWGQLRCRASERPILASRVPSGIDHVPAGALLIVLVVVHCRLNNRLGLGSERSGLHLGTVTVANCKLRRLRHGSVRTRCCLLPCPLL